MIVRTTCLLAVTFLSAGAAAAATPFCGYPVRNEMRDGYVCVGRWVARDTGRSIRCEDGSHVRERVNRCTQWQLTGGGTLVNPNPPPIQRQPPVDRRREVPRDGPRQQSPPPRLN